jgi:hypothetical protein
VKVNRNETGFAVILNLVDGDEPIKLTNAAVKAVFVTPDGTRTEKTAALSDPENGICRTTIDAEETATEGVLEMQIQVTIGDSRYLSEIQHITVADSL